MITQYYRTGRDKECPLFVWGKVPISRQKSKMIDKMFRGELGKFFTVGGVEFWNSRDQNVV